MTLNENNIDDVLKNALPSASEEEREAARRRVYSRARSEAGENREGLLEDVSLTIGSQGHRMAMVAAVAAIVLAVFIGILGSSTLRRQPAAAVVESLNGALYRIAEGKAQALPIKTAITMGETIRSNVGSTGTLLLADGSRLDMRPQSELRLEPADDGVRVFLKAGGLLVTASEQRNGHLYVETKDVTVSVVGTVFLVNAEEEGSRVAVIQGEVHVQQGALVQKLLPGEQVVTSAAMPRVAPPTLALLHQSAALVGAPPDRFEVVSIRPSPPPPQGSRGGGGGGGGSRQNRQPCVVRQLVQLDPSRLLISRATLHGLIAKAYGVDCNLPDGIAGEPEWAALDRYEIEARLPSGTSAYTRSDFLEGKAPELQRMLQNLLLDRFKLRLRREIRETPAYNLVVAKLGEWECHLPASCHGIRLSEDQDPDAVPVDREGMTPIPTTLNLHETISGWTSVVTLNTGRPVIDKTGLKGYYDIRLEYPEIGPPPASIEDVERLRTDRRARFISTIEQQLGFKLEPTTALVEILTVEHVERPSEN